MLCVLVKCSTAHAIRREHQHDFVLNKIWEDIKRNTITNTLIELYTKKIANTCEGCTTDFVAVLRRAGMRSGNAVIPATAVFLLLLSGLSLTGACNKALCASDVSKCLIQELCQCRPTDGNCSCCKECMLCLGTLWDECCDCVGMCNPKNYSDTPPTSKSTVEELHEPIPSLFRALTEGETQLNWNIVSFPVAEELSHHENLVSFLETLDEAQSQNVSVPGNSIHARYDSDKDHMCTVVYFDDCMSIHQCKVSCESMGASKYRWFHNACCECIGPECIDYGSKSVKCMNCMF